MDSKVSMICTEAHESFWIQISTIWEVGLQKEPIGMAIPITNKYGRELEKEKVVLQ